MRDYILLFINGREHRISGANAFIPVTDYLRGELGSCGTKVVCAEGDCGACTVMLGRPPEDAKAEKLEYKPVNSCIQYVFQLDCSHIVTVEGLKLNGKLNPVQQSMVECHGAQCGYCTPGFVVAMCSMFDQGKPLSEWEIRDGLVGNLCRCTGYEPIVRAGLSVDLEDWSSFETLYPSSKMIKQLREARRQTAHIKVD